MRWHHHINYMLLVLEFLMLVESMDELEADEDSLELVNYGYFEDEVVEVELLVALDAFYYI